MSFSDSKPRSKRIAEYYDVIEARLRANTKGLTRKQLLHTIGWPDNPAANQRLKRMLESLRIDPSSDVVAVKNGQTYGAETDKLPNTKHEIVWRLNKPLSNKADVEAITLVTAKKYASIFLPPEQRLLLEQRYKDLYQTGPSMKLYEKWHDKVRIASRYPPLFPNLSSHYSTNEETIFEALQTNMAFSGRYDFDNKPSVYFPVRLLRREQVLYVLCATKEQPDQFREYAIHRFSKVVPNKASLKQEHYAPAFIDSHTKAGVTGPWKIYSEMVIRIKGPATHHFLEMRFHPEQDKQPLTQIKPEFLPDEDDNTIKSALITIKDLHYNYEIRTWLLGLGPNVEVLEPSEIRNDIAEQAIAMAQKYQT